MMSAVVSSANIHVKRPEQTKRVIYVDIKTGEQVLIINKSHSCPGSRSSSVSSPCSTPVHSRPSSAISSQSSTESSSSSSSDKSRNLKGAISKYLCGVNSHTQVNE